MNKVTDVTLNGLIQRIREDARIGPSHVSVLWALSVIHIQQGQKGFIEFRKEDVSNIAKISFTSFYRCMRDLDKFEYIRYVPSFHAKVRSRLWFLCG